MTSHEREQIRQIMEAHCRTVWAAFSALYPDLRTMPDVQVSGRLTRTAGRCWQPENIVEFGTKFLMHSRETQIIMMQQIVPHELAHAADWQLYGESEMKCGHGRGWREIMMNYGLPPNRFHRMELE
jgi:predicted SprT family Zn-dependent metalloprotease